MNEFTLKKMLTTKKIKYSKFGTREKISALGKTRYICYGLTILPCSMAFLRENSLLKHTHTLESTIFIQ